MMRLSIESSERRKLRILTVASLFPPNVIGGAEMSAWNAAQWLRSRGHEVGVLTTGAVSDREIEGEVINGFPTWRFRMPRPYPIIDFQSATKVEKIAWHVQDHVDPRNRGFLKRALRAFKPDLANVHVVQGLGHNIFPAFEEASVPVCYFLHDLGLACLKQSMFKNGHNCRKQCAECVVSSAVKRHYAQSVSRLGFISPSQANLDRVADYFPIGSYVNKAILNPNKYPQPTHVPLTRRAKLDVLYVGRIHHTKGVDILLEAIGSLKRSGELSVTVVGDGPDLKALQERFGDEPWCTFKGFQPQAEISNLMSASDLLCVPSIWAENSPGVAIHALWLGLPVFGSDRGGIPELVKDGVTGRILPPGDVGAWAVAIESALDSPSELNAWRTNARERSHDFDQDVIGLEIEKFLYDLVSVPADDAPHGAA